MTLLRRLRWGKLEATPRQPCFSRDRRGDNREHAFLQEVACAVMRQRLSITDAFRVRSSLKAEGFVHRWIPPLRTYREQSEEV